MKPKKGYKAPAWQLLITNYLFALPMIANLAVCNLLCSPALAATPPNNAIRSTIIRQADDSESVQFALTLPLRDQSGLDQAIKNMYDTKSPQYRHFLSVSEFESKYAPTAADYSALRSFAIASGLSIVREPPGRTLLDVSGSVATIRHLFGTQMQWRQRKSGKQYLWADKEPVPPSSLALIGGNAAVLRQMPPEPMIRRRNAPTPVPNGGTGPSRSYLPSDIQTAYNLTSIPKGGTPVALYELASAVYNDARVYASRFGLNNPTLIQETVDGGTTSTTYADEVTLDIDMVIAVSDSTSMYIYTGNPSISTGQLDTYNQIASDNFVGQVSSSWNTGCEIDVGASTMNAENSVFTQMVAQGIAVFIALGDYGADTPCLNGSGPQLFDPGSQPNVTSAGGTSIRTSMTQTYLYESVWNDLPPPGEATGGGVSAYWPIPSYQTGLTVVDSQFSSTKRNAPDMSLNSDLTVGYYYYCSTCGGWGVGGGTSAVAPQLAAFWSLVSKGLGHRAGFANPTLYSIAKQPAKYASDFHDVVPSNLPNSNGYYDSFTGYDNATGLGSYNGANLYADAKARVTAKRLAPIINLLLNH